MKETFNKQNEKEKKLNRDLFQMKSEMQRYK